MVREWPSVGSDRKSRHDAHDDAVMSDGVSTTIGPPAVPVAVAALAITCPRLRRPRTLRTRLLRTSDEWATRDFCAPRDRIRRRCVSRTHPPGDAHREGHYNTCDQVLRLTAAQADASLMPNSMASCW
jgi:hypothetical protein